MHEGCVCGGMLGPPTNAVANEGYHLIMACMHKHLLVCVVKHQLMLYISLNPSDPEPLANFPEPYPYSKPLWALPTLLLKTVSGCTGGPEIKRSIRSLPWPSSHACPSHSETIYIDRTMHTAPDIKSTAAESYGAQQYGTNP